jgi:hypothetical protein
MNNRTNRKPSQPVVIRVGHVHLRDAPVTLRVIVDVKDDIPPVLPIDAFDWWVALEYNPSLATGLNEIETRSFLEGLNSFGDWDVYDHIPEQTEFRRLKCQSQTQAHEVFSALHLLFLAHS